ncbi:MAG: glycosyltransferase family 4 protein [bacterium]
MMPADNIDHVFRGSRVLFFIRGGGKGGAELSLLEILQRMNRNRFLPVLASLTEGPVVDEIREMGIETHVLEAPGKLVEARRQELASPAKIHHSASRFFSSIRVARQLAGLLRETGCHLLYANSLKAHVIGSVAGWLAGVPVVWHVRDVLFHRWERILFRLLRFLFRPTVIANSRFTAGHLGGGRGIKVIYNGVDLAATKPGRDAARVREELGIPPDAPLVGMAGRVQQWKGHEVFLAAAEMLLDDFPDAWFAIAGGDLYSEEHFLDNLKKGVRGNDKLKNRVVFTGHRKDVLDIINTFDVYVHPTLKDEPFGRVIMEAMALGKPVVTTRCGGPEEIVLDEYTGLMVAAGDAKALSRAVGRLLIDRETAKKFGANGRRRVEEMLPLDKTIWAVEQTLEEAMR